MNYAELLKLVETKKQNTNDLCQICYLDNNLYSTTLLCNHKYHWDCIKKYIIKNRSINTVCPYCSDYFIIKELEKKCTICNKITFYDSKKCKLHLKKPCSYILKSGKNKGKNCSKYCLDNSKFCRIHSKLTNITLCKAILKSGKNKGNQCTLKTYSNYDFCKRHCKIYQQSPNIEI